MMMNCFVRATRLCAATCALLAPVSTQDQAGLQIPKPASELQKYQPMLGVWEGSGEVIKAPGEAPSKWTAESTVQWALSNFFVEEKLRVSFGGTEPPIVMHNFYGFDPESKSHRLIGASNRGSVDLLDVTWTDAGTLVGVRSGNAQGKPYAERWVTRFAKDSYELKLDFAWADTPAYTKVTGRFTRAKVSPASFQIADAVAMGPVPPEQKKLSAMIGRWNVKGSMIPAPGAPSMPISGIETIQPVFGGSLLRAHTIGDPNPGMPGRYESFSYLTWDANHAAYDLVFVGNMGESGKLEGRFAPDGSLVWTGAAPHMGSASAVRCVQTFTDSGLVMTCDRLHGTADALREMTLEYSKSQ
jgi:hypothetical protein